MRSHTENLLDLIKVQNGHSLHALVFDCVYGGVHGRLPLPTIVMSLVSGCVSTMVVVTQL